MIKTDDTTVKMINNDQERRYNDVQNTAQKTNFRMIMQNNPIIFY